VRFPPATQPHSLHPAPLAGANATAPLRRSRILTSMALADRALLDQRRDQCRDFHWIRRTISVDGDNDVARDGREATRSGSCAATWPLGRMASSPGFAGPGFNAQDRSSHLGVPVSPSLPVAPDDHHRLHFIAPNPIAAYSSNLTRVNADVSPLSTTFTKDINEMIRPRFERRVQDAVETREGRYSFAPAFYTSAI
jgi:hypothetical protein